MPALRAFWNASSLSSGPTSSSFWPYQASMGMLRKFLNEPAEVGGPTMGKARAHKSGQRLPKL